MLLALTVWHRTVRTVGHIWPMISQMSLSTSLRPILLTDISLPDSWSLTLCADLCESAELDRVLHSHLNRKEAMVRRRCLKHTCTVHPGGLSVSVLTKKRFAYPVVRPSFSRTCRAFQDYVWLQRGLMPLHTARYQQMTTWARETLDGGLRETISEFQRAEGHNCRVWELFLLKSARAGDFDASLKTERTRKRT